MVALSATPLRRLTANTWVTNFTRYRRAIGVASFGYAALHTGVYLERKWGAGLILKEGLEPELAAGWLAFGVFLLLALTSNDASTRTLGPQWKRLHRSVYLAAVLTFAHWVLASFDSQIAYICLAALVLVEMLRFAPQLSCSGDRTTGKVIHTTRKCPAKQEHSHSTAKRDSRVEYPERGRA
jgi:sulfoxide reductase heme-binding subunit YedZ